MKKTVLVLIALVLISAVPCFAVNKVAGQGQVFHFAIPYEISYCHLWPGQCELSTTAQFVAHLTGNRTKVHLQ
jgi:hypothetical protein